MRTLIAIAGLALTAACGTSTAAAPASIAISGTISVAGGSTIDGLDGGSGQRCWTERGYKDIAEGTAVTVTDATGKTVALGALGAGSLTLERPGYWYSRRCVFPFTVRDVPAGGKFYGVEVSHRGRLQYTMERLCQPLELTLGD